MQTHRTFESKAAQASQPLIRRLLLPMVRFPVISKDFQLFQHTLDQTLFLGLGN